jgi:hypothetical protein
MAIIRTAKALMGGLSLPQMIGVSIFAGSLVFGAAGFAIWSYGNGKFKEGAESRNVYISEIETKLVTATNRVLELEPLLQTCQSARISLQSENKALHQQNAEAAKKAAEVLLKSQEIGQQAIAAANRSNQSNRQFFENLNASLKGLKNECDQNGNGIVRNGADILRGIQQRSKG